MGWYIGMFWVSMLEGCERGHRVLKVGHKEDGKERLEMRPGSCEKCGVCELSQVLNFTVNWAPMQILERRAA